MKSNQLTVNNSQNIVKQKFESYSASVKNDFFYKDRPPEQLTIFAKELTDSL